MSDRHPSPGPPEKEIIAAARRGDERAWDVIYEHLHRPVFGFLRLRGADDPENLLGETFFRLARGISRFRGDLSGLKAYAMTIAANLVRDQVRRSAARPTLNLAEPAEIETLRAAHRAHQPAPEDQVIEATGLADVERLLGTLTDDQRDVVYLRFVADLSVKETARTLSRSQGAVKQLQHRALNALRDIVGDGWEAGR